MQTDRVKFFNPQNTAGVLQEKGVAIISRIVVVTSDWDLKFKQKKKKSE